MASYQYHSARIPWFSNPLKYRDPPKPIDHESEVIVANPIHFKTEDGMVRAAQDEVAAILQNQELSPGRVHGRRVVTNQSGLEYVERAFRLDAVEKCTKVLENDVNRLKTQMAIMQQQNGMSTTSFSEEHRATRNRFISVAKRNIFKTATQNDHLHIKKGNEAAHGGNIQSDAQLYRIKDRDDYEMFETLYGIRYVDMGKFCCESSAAEGSIAVSANIIRV